MFQIRGLSFGPLLLLALSLAGCVHASGAGQAGFWLTMLTVLFLFACSQTIQTNEEPTADAGTTQRDNTQLDRQTTDEGGVWEDCCKNGRIESCYCPGNANCNYGRFERCSDNTCIEPNSGKSCTEASAETGIPDRSVEAVKEAKPEPIKEMKPEPTREAKPEPIKEAKPEPIKEAKPEPIKEAKPEPKPEKVRDGTWQPCCRSGKISTCFCPTGLACNYGWFTKCKDETCVGPGQKCP